MTTPMKNVWTIAKREFNMYFVSPVAYAVAFAFLGILGLIFYANLSRVANFGGSPEFVQWVLSPFVTLMLFLSPGVTMRLMSEEQRTGTVELLLTAPVREWELVTGKWLAAFGFMAVIVFVTGLYALVLNNYTTPGLDRGALDRALRPGPSRGAHARLERAPAHHGPREYASHHAGRARGAPAR